MSKFTRRSFLAALPFIPVAVKAALARDETINPEWEQLGPKNDVRFVFNPVSYNGELTWENLQDTSHYLYRRIWETNPYAQLLDGGTFPENMGETKRSQ